MSAVRPLCVLVLCSGNIGRSPLAAAMLEDALKRELGVADVSEAGVTIGSAGTAAPDGHEASQRGIAFAADHGLDLASHRASRLTVDHLGKCDLIYAMDRHQISGVGALSIDAVARTVLWAGEQGDIPDPHGESDDFFADVAARIESAVPDRVAELVAMLAARRGLRTA